MQKKNLLKRKNMNTMIIISHNNLRFAAKHKHKTINNKNKTINNWLRTQTNRENFDLQQKSLFPSLRLRERLQDQIS